MKIDCKELIKKNKRMLLFIPIFIVYIVIVELILGFGMKNNSIWDKGSKWSKGN